MDKKGEVKKIDYQITRKTRNKKKTTKQKGCS